MGPKFREDKVTQAASVILQRSNGTIKYIKLLKLLYLADRKALQDWERPITYDKYVSMKNGLVPSWTYDLIKNNYPETTGYWNEHIIKSGRYQVSLKYIPAPEKLSPAEIKILNQIYDEYGNWDEFDLCEYTHSLAEYKPTEHTSIPTPLDDVLRALGNDSKEIERIDHEISNEACINAILGG